MAIEVTVLDEYEILADLQRIAQEKGLINEVFETSRINIYYAVFARVFGTILQTIASYISNIQIDDCTDEAVLEILLKPFIEKRTSRVAKTILTFTRRNFGENAEDIFIPRGLEVETEEMNPIVFRTAESKIFWKDAYQIRIPAYCVDFGTIGNVAENTLRYFEGDLFQEVDVTNESPAFGGVDEETAFDTRNRLANYRYIRDGSKQQIEDAIGELGYFGSDYNIKEYWDGLGSVLIALDCNSDDEFYDAVAQLERKKVVGVKYHYMRVMRVNVDFQVNVKILGKQTYDSYTVNDLEDSIKTAVNIFFNQNIYVGFNVNIKKLEAFILNYIISSYDIYALEVIPKPKGEIEIDEETQRLIIQPYQRILANDITIDTDYDYTEDDAYGTW